MTVKELIEILKEKKPDDKVFYLNYAFYGNKEIKKTWRPLSKNMLFYHPADSLWGGVYMSPEEDL
jgi:hypothetical protein